MKKPIKISITVQRINETLSRMSILNNPSLKQDVSLCSSIILCEFRYYVILRFKISPFVLCLWSPRCFQLCLINRLSKLSFIKFRVQLHFGFELAQHRLQSFCSLLLLRLMQKTFQFPFQFLFPFFPFSSSFLDGLPKVFQQLISLDNKKVCDQVRTYFIGRIKKSLCN